MEAPAKAKPRAGKRPEKEASINASVHEGLLEKREHLAKEYGQKREEMNGIIDDIKSLDDLVSRLYDPGHQPFDFAPDSPTPQPVTIAGNEETAASPPKAGGSKATTTKAKPPRRTATSSKQTEPGSHTVTEMLKGIDRQSSMIQILEPAGGGPLLREVGERFINRHKFSIPDEDTKLRNMLLSRLSASLKKMNDTGIVRRDESPDGYRYKIAKRDAEPQADANSATTQDEPV